jgi:5-methylcytosine-specific restriction endonuclease McrA
VSRLPRVCLVDLCPNVAVAGTNRCATHPPARSPSSQATSQAGWKAKRLATLERDDWVCFYCGGPATTADHLQRASEGGSNELSNLVAACWPCNRRRG